MAAPGPEATAVTVAFFLCLAYYGPIARKAISLTETFRRSSPLAGGGRAEGGGLMGMYTVYAIYNKEAGKFYIGQTVDLEKRLQLHNSRAFGGYTSRFSGQWIVIYSEEHSTRQEALRREKQLKSFQGRRFVKKFIPA